MNVVSNECGLKWIGLKWMWSQLKKSHVNVVSYEEVSNEVVSIFCTPLSLLMHTNYIIGKIVKIRLVERRISLYHRRRGQEGQAYLIIVCFERRYPKQNAVVRLKSNILPHTNFFPHKKVFDWLHHCMSQMLAIMQNCNRCRRSLG